MKANRSFSSAFRRAATYFPAAQVAVSHGQETLKPAGFCVVSFDPAIVGVTFPRVASQLPGKSFTISAPQITLDCSLLESRDIGDHVMVLATVRNLEVQRGIPAAVAWRRASFQLRLDYPFLESAAALDAFIADWRTGVLPKNAWTHAAHVAATGYFAFDNPPEVVFAVMKRGILHFNTCTGVVNGPDSGYHETLTQFWSNRITTAVHDAATQSRFDAATCAVRLFGEDR